MIMIKKLFPAILLLAIITISSCSIFDNTELIEDTLSLVINDEKDIKYLEIDAIVGALHKMTFEETTSAQTEAKSSLMISLFENDDDFWDSSNEYNPVYKFRNDSERKVVLYFVPNTTPFFVQIDPFLDFYGTVDISIEKDIETQNIIKDGESHSYASNNDIKDDTFYVILELETINGKTYNFNIEGGGFNYVFNDLNDIYTQSIYSEFEYPATSSKAFLVKERYSYTETTMSFELAVTEN